MATQSSGPSPAALFVLHFAGVRDRRRVRRCTYPLLDLLAFVLVAFLCDCDDVADVPAFVRAHHAWFQEHFGVGPAVPDVTTLRRALAKLDPRTLAAAFLAWMNALAAALRPAEGEVLAIDGKSVKGAVDRASRSTPLHLLHVYATRARVLLAAQPLPRGAAGESPATVATLGLVRMAGAIVTVDANGCTAPVAAAVRAQGGHYIQQLKANRGPQHRAVLARFAALETDPPLAARARRALTEDTGHGRAETRCLVVLPCRDILVGGEPWPGLRSIVCLTRTRTVKRRTSVERHYYLTSLPPWPKKLLRAIRDHWKVENQVHWPLDVTWHEDRRTNTGDGATVLALIRRIAFNLLQRDTTKKDSLRRKRKIAAWDPAYRLHLLSLGIPEE